jgi:hypothetical protein
MADIDALEDSITDGQLKEWMSFYALEPWGSEIGFFQAGIVAAAVVNSSANRKQGSKGVSPADFMPKFGQPEVKKPAKELRQEFLAVFGARNKKPDGQD